MHFKYADFPAKPDGAFPNRTAIKRPILQMNLEKGGQIIRTLAIVDSGADFCLFPASMASALGIAIPNQNATLFSGSANAPQIAYFETVSVTIWNGDNAEAPITFDLYAGFCDTLEHVGLGLLGQNGFFSRFVVAFDHNTSTITVTERP
jgi:hypothetical protein